MNIELSYLVGPCLGAIIGYATNDIAIRMLFRPHYAKYVFGIKVPFTPGIIPKERFRIAEAVGQSINDNLMNKEVLEKNLLSDEMLAKIGEGYDTFVAKQKENSETLREFLGHFLSEEDLRAIQSDASKELASQIHSRLSESSLGAMVSHAVVEHAMNKMEHSLLGFASMAFGVDQFVELLAEPAERLLTKHVNEIISNNSEEIVTNLIGQESKNLLDTRICELLQGHDEQLAQLRHILLDGYSTIITTHLPKILSTIDISRIIRERINEMDMDESERLILQLMKKELRAIVWFGALLGFIIGSVNSFF